MIRLSPAETTRRKPTDLPAGTAATVMGSDAPVVGLTTRGRSRALRILFHCDHDSLLIAIKILLIAIRTILFDCDQDSPLMAIKIPPRKRIVIAMRES
jgi:hypothetical protein